MVARERDMSNTGSSFLRAPSEDRGCKADSYWRILLNYSAPVRYAIRSTGVFPNVLRVRRSLAQNGEDEVSNDWERYEEEMEKRLEERRRRSNRRLRL